MEKLEILGAAAIAGQEEVVYFLNFTNTDEERMLVAEFLRNINYQAGIAPDEIRSVAVESDESLETSECVAVAFLRNDRYHVISSDRYPHMTEYFKQIL